MYLRTALQINAKKTIVRQLKYDSWRGNKETKHLMTVKR